MMSAEGPVPEELLSDSSHVRSVAFVLMPGKEVDVTVTSQIIAAVPAS